MELGRIPTARVAAAFTSERELWGYRTTSTKAQDDVAREVLDRMALNMAQALQGKAREQFLARCGVAPERS